MTSPFLTFEEAAAYLRYDLSGPNGAKAKAALTKWLAKYGCRPSLKRKLYRRVQVDAAIERCDLAQTRRRNRGFKAHAARFQQGQRPSHGALVSRQSGCDVHAESLRDESIPDQCHSVVGAR